MGYWPVIGKHRGDDITPFNLGKRLGKKPEQLQNDDWPAGLRILGEDDFDSFIGKYPLSLVDFYSPTCVPCGAVSRAVRTLSREYRGRVAFGKVDVTLQRELAQRYKVMSVPYLVIFSHGKKVYTMMGKKSEKEISSAIDQMLEKYRRNE